MGFLLPLGVSLWESLGALDDMAILIDRPLCLAGGFVTLVNLPGPLRKNEISQIPVELLPADNSSIRLNITRVIKDDQKQLLPRFQSSLK